MSLNGLRLRYYTDDEIRSLAVVKVLNASTYDRGVPKIDGVNDARMGLSDHTIRCPTCYKSNCNQHYGYIELSRPVFRLGSINIVLMILRSVCRECARPKCSIDNVPGGLKERLKAISEMSRTKFTCPHCGAPQPVYTKRDRTFIDAVYRPRDLTTDFVKDRGPEYLEFLKARFMPDDAASILFALKDSLMFENAETLMCKLQIVPPPIIRPSNFAGQTRVRSENDMTVALQDIVRVNNELEKLVSGTKAFTDAYDKLQIVVSGLTNHAIKRSAAQKGILPVIAAISKRKVIDLRARLNGKKARIRGNLSGKRVDQSGRTVITGDSSHDIDQLGLPSCMMNKLTFPETVNAVNIEFLKTAIIIGAYQNNGALAVRPPSHDHDRVIWLPILDINSRRDLATQLRVGWTVERHLVNDDAVLFNRQPSLWKASMMCFRIYRVGGLTARLPLPVTRAFNADFDGDEMNVHALQSHEAIAEARELMKVEKQIITPQSGTVIIGLVQDSLVGAWRLTSRDCFFTREQAIALISKMNYEVSGRTCSSEHYSNSTESINFAVTHLPEPAILRPQLWTGKQLFSLLLPTDICIEKHGNQMAPNDETVLVRSGNLYSGRLSKSNLGASNTGLIQAIWRLYGPGGTHKFISDAQRVLVSHLDRDGPSQSIKDCLISTGSVQKTCMSILSNHLKRADQVLKLDLHEGIKEAKSNTILQETLRSVGSTVLAAIRKDCALSDCVNSGSKGNVMNIAQIGGCVGQQNIYGRRIPIRSTNLGPRTLIYYAPGDLRPEARGFVANSYISGLSPAEFFEHQMAGREGIVATAVNTSETGYNQRRMIKGQESQCVSYDGTVRVSNNCIIQCFYGGDDLDGSRLERIHLPWLPNANLGPQPECVSRCLAFAKKYASWNANFYKDLDLHFPCAVSISSLLIDYDGSETLQIDTFMQQLMGLHATHHAARRSMLTISAACAILQIAALKRPVSKANGAFILKKYAQALINPGEGVGALGASSIGEPSMQKTLNTFHYTGIADKNVTITGLPRFKQLINGVDTCETANVTAQVKSFEQCTEALQISNVMLYDIMKSSDITISRTSRPIFTQFKSRGPFSAKFCKVPDGLYEVITLKLQWTLCARKNITIDAVARALRLTFSYDAFIVKKPHWSDPVITIILAPWITGADAISAGLYAQQQIRGIDYIKNSIVLQENRYTDCVPRSQHVVETEGSNMVHIAACPFIVPETIRSTNVSEVCTVLGISAGVSILQSELHKVLSFDGTYVDARHSWLLADTMARCGSLAAMNRHHMEDLGSSFLQEASFERSLEVFEEGAAYGRSDPVAGSTERIIVGQPVSIGTGIVGIIAEKFDSCEEVLVAPLDSKTYNTSAAEIVGPLLRPAIENYDTSGWSKSVFEMSKMSSDSFNEEAFSTFRSIAALRRAVPKIEFKFKLTEGQYKNILKACYTYTWTICEPSHFTTKVHWQHGDKLGLTIIKNHKTQSYSHDVVHKSSISTKEAKIYIETVLDPQDVPFGVESLYTEMHHINYFTKSNFYIQLSKEWSGLTNVEAEENLLKARAATFATIGIVDTDDILRSRCTDAQLGNAIYERLSI
jgi:DNA-directed RNA polymerase beta' subunit